MNGDIKSYKYRTGENVMTKIARISHRIMLIKKLCQIPIAGLRGSISRSLVIHVDWEILSVAGFISIVVSEPPTPSWQGCVRTSMGLTLYEKRGGDGVTRRYCT
jgi:hypothetical protein